MGGEHQNRNGEECQPAGRVVSRESERKTGGDLVGATPGEAPANATRRRAERRQSSALIAWWGDSERRSGKDRRASPSGNDIDHD